MGKVTQTQSSLVQSADMELVYEAIDLRLKEMHELGIFWRKVDEVPLSFSLTASTNSASATADILFPIAMKVVDGSLDEPVEIIGRLEYAAIENKADTGTPTKALWKGGAEFLFHPVPDAATTAKLTYAKVADDTAASTAPDVEVSMMRSLVDLVKYDLIDQFSVPESKVQRWNVEATKAERRIKNLSAERKDYSTVAVEDSGRGAVARRETDYGR